MSIAATSREQEVAALYDEGFKPREIGERLGLSARYVSLIVFRLGLNDDGTDHAERLAMRFCSESLLKALRREGFA